MSCVWRSLEWHTACVVGICALAEGISPEASGEKKPMRCCMRRRSVLRSMMPCRSKGSALSYALRTSGVMGKA